jgi:catechol 2,3-dioxygenase-like lactoylglutathione lyase family enzyme
MFQRLSLSGESESTAWSRGTLDGGLATSDHVPVFGGGQGQGLVGRRQGTAYRAPVHVALSTDRAGVDAFYEAALAAGGTDNGAPGSRPTFPNYYAAYVRDSDGNNIEAVCRTA